MIGQRWRALLRISGFALILILPILAVAQEDPNPNSPTPVLISEPGSTRALAVQADTLGRRESKSFLNAFAPGSAVKIFVGNVDLDEGEAANAFRVYAADSRGRSYRFQILGIQLLETSTGLYAVTIRLKDEIGYWGDPARGDTLLRLTWRGLTSNRVRLGYGSTGGRIKDDPGSVPTPLISLGPIPAQVAQNADAAPNAVGYRWSGDRMRFLQQATFGPTQALDDRVRRIGLRTYLSEQLEAPYPSANNPYPNIPLKNTDAANATNGCGMFASGTLESRTCLRDHYSMYPVQKWFFQEAFYGDAQLRHRVAWALSQIWVISGVDTQQSSWMLAYYQTLAKNAFGNYRQLMEDVTLNPGMGNYLDMVRSTRNNPNENYPREILQLFTIGLFMLNPDGTLQRDLNGDPIPTYDQTTINNFTRVFTGWTFCNTTCPNSSPGLVNYKDPMVIVNTNNHDTTAKTLLTYPGSNTTDIQACTGCTGAQIVTYANNSLVQTLDNIFYHPNVGPFVSRQLIQHLVTSDPTPAYVSRVAAVFNNNGAGVRGDMKSVIRAILLDPEARGDVKTDPNFGKLREPVQFMTSIYRAFNVRSANGTTNSDGVVAGLSTAMAQNPFNSPTVFNYYSPDYVVPGTSLNGPEFGLMTTGTSIARANFVNTTVFGTIPVSENAPNGTSVDLSEMQTLAAADSTGNLLLDALSHKLLHGKMSADMRARILPAVAAIAATDPLGRARAAVYLVAASSQFQVQR